MDTTFRPVGNEDAALEVLGPLGFERFVPSEMPVADQIRLFATADTMMSPHGAGLVNVIHASDATVVKLFPENNVEAYYFVLAQQLGLDYHLSQHPTDGDTMIVDTEALRTTVSRILAG